MGGGVHSARVEELRRHERQLADLREYYEKEGRVRDQMLFEQRALTERSAADRLEEQARYQNVRRGSKQGLPPSMVLVNPT